MSSVREASVAAQNGRSVCRSVIFQDFMNTQILFVVPVLNLTINISQVLNLIAYNRAKSLVVIDTPDRDAGTFAEPLNFAPPLN